MPSINCSRCSETIDFKIIAKASHTLLQENSSEQLCFACFKKLDQFDVVEVISTNTDTPEAQIGEKAIIIDIYEDNAFEIECVLKDGTNKWIGAFTRDQIKAIL